MKETFLPHPSVPVPCSLFPVPLYHPSKRGSALLIVLGMMAFMVISAVAFSAYMRYSRLPSSYLRRSSSSRLLVKAALAEAIDEIDSAIGNNPHPGIGQNAYMYEPERNSRAIGTAINRNVWKNRVYLGTNNVMNLVSPDETVSPLCLEALAYLPPALVNDVRYYSRRTTSARWKSLAFDSGRYAFCAVDVSDHLNVNAMKADVARSGSADDRISLAYLFESDDHSSASGSGGNPSNWDTFMENFEGKNKVPLVSMADWNLAINRYKPGGWLSQFCEYVNQGRTSFYGGIGPESAEADKIRRQAFVTDSYFPDNEEAEESGLEHLDLDEETSQPFTKGELRATKSLAQIADAKLANDKMFQRLEQCIDPLGFCALYDYLDNNDDPLSLAIPTTERVPMICGLSPTMANGTIEVDVSTPIDKAIEPNPSAAKPGDPYTITLQVKYAIKGLPNAPMQATVVYPFRHENANNNNTYELGGQMAYFLSFEGDEVGLRTKTTKDILHVGYAGALNSYKNVDNAVVAVGFRPQALNPSSFTGGTSGPQGAVKMISLTPAGIIPTSVDFLDVTYSVQGVFEADTDGNAVIQTKHLTPSLENGYQVQGEPKCNWMPLAANGTISPAFAGSLKNTLSNAGYTKKLKLNLAVWAWVKNKATGRYVDMVPACVYDDADLNSRNTDSRSKMWGQQFLGAAYPVMRFDMAAGGAAVLEFNSSAIYKGALASSGSSALAVTPPAVMVCDPRYNHAPESWFQLSGGNLTEQQWLDNCECGYKASSLGRRDGDIFMSVSDNEELQSIYELANLPRFTDFFRKGSQYQRTNYANPDAKNFLSFPANASDTANIGYMWRTYDPFGLYQDGGDDFDGTCVHSSSEGFRVTPYSTQTNVMMAAFANTPHEWRLSSANEDTMSSVPEDAKGFNSKYAWNAYSSGARIKWEDLEDLCGVFMEDMRLSNGTKHWEDVWADLGWLDFNKTGEERSKYLLNGMQLTDTSEKGRIWNSDRKFLYGFWHDCFALKQQLFLVFVRAEPSMMGGGGVKQTPPQLGAKAVALVWRDPTVSSVANAPHQTRVLFYRQFD